MLDIFPKSLKRDVNLPAFLKIIDHCTSIVPIDLGTQAMNIHEDNAKKLNTLAIRRAISESNVQLLLNSKCGVKLVKVELINLFSKIEQISTCKPDRGQKVIDTVYREWRSCTIQGGKFAVQIRWDAKYKNSLEDSALLMILSKGIVKQKKALFFRPRIKIIETTKFAFHIKTNGSRGWKKKNGAKDEYLSSDQLALIAFNLLKNTLRKAETRKI